MERPIPSDPPEVNESRVRRDGLITHLRRYSLITPLFGGGVTPGETDPVTIINGKGIRGQLRFWWRATRGSKPEFAGRFEKMKVAEDFLWGAASTKGYERPSRVQITVERRTGVVAKKPFEVVRKAKDGNQIDRLEPNEDVAPAYAAFPLQPEAPHIFGMETRTVLEGDGAGEHPPLGFLLTISFHGGDKEDVEAALWAWETFGGVGGRTRRGFGALELVNLKVNGQGHKILPINDGAGYFRQRLECHVVDGKFPPNIPHLSRDVLPAISTTRPTAYAAWKYLIDTLQQFRQSRSDKDGNPSSFGKSDWPEGDEIRRLLKKKGVTLGTEAPNTTIKKFPRGVFGLPIIFHFPQDPAHPDTTLKGSETRTGKGERLASPLILRPFALGSGRYAGLGLILNTPQNPPEGFKLEWRDPSQSGPVIWDVEHKLTPTEADKVKPLNRGVDVLKTFLRRIH